MFDSSDPPDLSAQRTGRIAVKRLSKKHRTGDV